jgi:hypothetical protein
MGNGKNNLTGGNQSVGRLPSISAGNVTRDAAYERFILFILSNLLRILVAQGLSF